MRRARQEPNTSLSSREPGDAIEVNGLGLERASSSLDRFQRCRGDRVEEDWENPRRGVEVSVDNETSSRRVELGDHLTRGKT